MQSPGKSPSCLISVDSCTAGFSAAVVHELICTLKTFIIIYWLFVCLKRFLCLLLANDVFLPGEEDCVTNRSTMNVKHFCLWCLTDLFFKLPPSKCISTRSELTSVKRCVLFYFHSIWSTCKISLAMNRLHVAMSLCLPSVFCFNLVCFPFPRGMYLTLGNGHLLVSHKNHWADGILNQHVRVKSWWCSIFLLSTNGTERPKPTQCFVDRWEHYDWRNILSSKVQLTSFFFLQHDSAFFSMELVSS